MPIPKHTDKYKIEIIQCKILGIVYKDTYELMFGMEPAPFYSRKHVRNTPTNNGTVNGKRIIQIY